MITLGFGFALKRVTGMQCCRGMLEKDRSKRKKERTKKTIWNSELKNYSHLSDNTSYCVNMRTCAVSHRCGSTWAISRFGNQLCHHFQSRLTGKPSSSTTFSFQSLKVYEPWQIFVDLSNYNFLFHPRIYNFLVLHVRKLLNSPTTSANF